jgi:hypothetical protein
MAKLFSVHRDSLSIRITEYYPVLRGDTASRGSVRSETELHYTAVDTASKTVITAESIRERDSTFTIRETVSSEHKETAVSVRPWFDSRQFYLTAAAVIIIIVLIIIRRFT